MSKYSSVEKRAAFEQLTATGLNFDQALALIEKEAGAFGAARGAFKSTASMVAGKAKSFATAIKTDGAKLPNQVKAFTTGKTTLKGTRFSTPVSVDKMTAGKALAGNAALQTGVGTMAAAGAAGAALGSRGPRDKEKRACVEQLVNSGMDFSTAVELVKQAEEELYGK
jgi:hypothetical protein